jgi:hypothetical protein
MSELTNAIRGTAAQANKHIRDYYTRLVSKKNKGIQDIAKTAMYKKP